MELKIYSNVTLGENVEIQSGVIIGEPPMGKKDGDLETIIGDNSLIRSGTIIYAGNKIGDNFQTGHYAVIRENNQIGNNVSVGSYSHVAFDCVIEDDVRIHTRVGVFEKSILRKGCWLGPNVALSNAKYPSSPRAKEFIDGCEIGEGAKLGMGVLLTPGIKVGEGALVGLGSIVTRDVEKYSLVVGSPAKKIKDVRDLTYPDGEKVYLGYTG